MNNLQRKLLVMLFLVVCGQMAFGATTTQTFTNSCPGGGNSTIVVTTDNETGRVETIVETNCAGVTRTRTYSYPTNIILTHSPITGGATITKTGGTFEVSAASKIEIVAVSSASVVYTYPSTVAANTTTPLWGGLSPGVYLLVARDPSNNMTVYCTHTFFQP